MGNRSINLFIIPTALAALLASAPVLAKPGVPDGPPPEPHEEVLVVIRGIATGTPLPDGTVVETLPGAPGHLDK